MKTKWNLNSFTWVSEDHLPSFGKILSSWLDVHKNFCEGFHPDFSWEWGQNERSQIGFLANAVTLIDGLSLEECRIEKHYPTGKSEGHSDLWLRLNPPNSDNDYLIEAKIEQYFEIADLSTSHQKLVKQMNSARDNTLCLKGRKEKTVAMTFLSLRYPDADLGKFEQKTDEFLSYLWTKARLEHNLHAIGAIWMSAAELKRSREERRQISPN